MKIKEVIKYKLEPIARLIDKGTIALSIKRRKGDDTCVLIAKMNVYGGSSSQLLISVPGKGSTVVDIGNIRMQNLFLVGLSPTEAKLLKKELDKLFMNYI